MKRATAVTLATLAAAAAVFGWWRSRPEQRVHRAFRALVADVSKPGPEGALASAARARSAASRFTAEPVLELDELPFQPATRGELAQAILRARAAVTRVEVRLYDTSVERGETPGTAHLRTTARMVVESAGAGADVRTRELALDWEHTPDGWCISTARTVRAIRRL